jgi:hemolysin activation/secretion protein
MIKTPFGVAVCSIFAITGALGAIDLPPLDLRSFPPNAISTQPTLVVREFHLRGNTVFSDAQLQPILKPYLGKPVTIEQLEDARLALTRFYVDRGFINSGAVLSDQTVTDGIVTFDIVEGHLTDVRLKFVNDLGMPAPHLLRESYVVSRVRQGSDGPLNIVRLKNQLDLLRQDPNIQNINAELRPGLAPGQSVLDLLVHETNPFQFGIQFSNRRPPSVGEAAFDVLASDRDLTGNGDLLAVRYDVLNGPLDDMRLDGADDYSIDYTIPVTPFDTTVEINFTRTDTIVSETPFQELGISSQSDNFALTVRQPIIRRPVAQPATDAGRATPAMDFDLFGSFALRDDRTRLGGEPFSFSSGGVNGVSHVTALRFGQELTLRDQESAFSVRSTFSFGVPWFDSTPDNGPNGPAGGKFFSWLGQAQYVRLLHQIGPMSIENWQFVARIAGQAADRNLLTLEQFAIGGVDTVRGYPENEIVRDEGLAASVELHIPAVIKHGATILDVIPFFDVGYGINHGDAPPKSQVLYSPGVGFVFTPNSHVTAQLYYGIPLTSFVRDHQNAQDYGIHFNVLLLAF